MPAEVRESADQAIEALQNARPLPPKLYQSLGGKLTGINEIRLGYDDNTYRVYVTLKCHWVVMVLDAGMKKSTEGKNIPKWQKERLETRHKGRANTVRSTPLISRPTTTNARRGVTNSQRRTAHE
jgi:phage-related protein